MPTEEEYTNVRLVFSLAFPASILYLTFLASYEPNFTRAAVGYVAMGLAFGLLQSLFNIRKRYLVAFLSTALVPILAYLGVAGLGVLISLQVIILGQPGLIYSMLGLSGGIPTTPLPYIDRLGEVLGTLLFLVVISVIVVPFGLTGVAGCFLGQELSRMVFRFSLKGASIPRGIASTARKSSVPKEVRAAKIAAAATLGAAVVSALASVLAALLE